VSNVSYVALPTASSNSRPHMYWDPGVNFSLYLPSPWPAVHPLVSPCNSPCSTVLANSTTYPISLTSIGKWYCPVMTKLAIAPSGPHHPPASYIIRLHHPYSSISALSHWSTQRKAALYFYLAKELPHHRMWYKYRVLPCWSAETFHKKAPLFGAFHGNEPPLYCTSSPSQIQRPQGSSFDLHYNGTKLRSLQPPACLSPAKLKPNPAHSWRPQKHPWPEQVEDLKPTEQTPPQIPPFLV